MLQEWASGAFNRSLEAKRAKLAKAAAKAKGRGEKAIQAALAALKDVGVPACVTGVGPFPFARGPFIAFSRAVARYVHNKPTL